MSVPRRYSELTIGAQFPDTPAEYHVTRETIAAYRAIGRGTADEGSPADDAVAPPTLAAVYIRPAQNALNGPPGGIHAKQRLVFLAPVHAGDTLQTVLEIQELYERNGRNFVVSETRTTNQQDTLVCTGLITQVWGLEK